MQVQKKMGKGKPLECIADELEEDAENIKPIWEVVSKNPTATAEDVLKLLSGVDVQII